MPAKINTICSSTGQTKGTYVKSHCYKATESKPAKPRFVVPIAEDEPLVRHIEGIVNQ